MPLFKPIFSSWVRTLRKYLEAILRIACCDGGQLARVKLQTPREKGYRVTEANYGSGFELGQNNTELQELKVICGACSTPDTLQNLHQTQKSECKIQEEDDITLLTKIVKNKKQVFVYKTTALNTEIYLQFLRESISTVTHTFVQFCIKALRSDDTDLETALFLTENLSNVATFLGCQFRGIYKEKWWGLNTPNRSLITTRVSGLNFNVSKGIKSKDIPNSLKITQSCLHMLREYKAVIQGTTKVQLQLAYLQQVCFLARL